MAFASVLSNIAPGDQVRFKDEQLSILTPADRKRLEGRVGEVQGRWNSTRKLTVLFPEEAGRPLLRILSVDPSHLERVSERIGLTEPPEVADEGGSNAKLSQEDTDNLFG